MNMGIFECYEQYRHALRWPFFELAHCDVAGLLEQNNF